MKKLSGNLSTNFGQSGRLRYGFHPNGYVQQWITDKKDSGKWLPKAEYERLTGRMGRRDTII
jgi:hypothetical protein